VERIELVTKQKCRSHRRAEENAKGLNVHSNDEDTENYLERSTAK
jgi:hypothetical protein